MTTTSPPEPASVEVTGLVVTRRFARSYMRISPASRARCDLALGWLIKGSHGPVLRLQAVQPTREYLEIRVGFWDHLVFRLDGTDAVLIDLLTFRDILGLQQTTRWQGTGR